MSKDFESILSEHYAGTEIGHIDQLQSSWRRSLHYALDDRLGDRLYDLLICVREGMINALIHGCERSPEKFAHLQVNLSADRETLRIVIDDPGRGHNYDVENPLEGSGSQIGKHLGLGVIYHLCDEFRIENRGTSLTFEFRITAEPPEGLPA